jgi:peptide/nickel transport system permease protein
MTEPSVYGKSYGEIVVHAFRKNRSARVALWISTLMIVLAILTPLLANDRPYAFKGSLPGEYRKAYTAVTRGAVMAIITIPGRYRAEAEKFANASCTLNDYYKHVTPEEARASYDAILRLGKRAEGIPDIRGRWASRDVEMSEVLAELTPAERPPVEAAIARIRRDLPALYQKRLEDGTVAFRTKLAELGDQTDADRANKAAGLESRLREAIGSGYLDTKGERRAAIQTVVDEIKATFDPDKVTLVERWRYPLLASLDSLDVLFLMIAVLAIVVFGPLTWFRLRRVQPIERRWTISWVAILAPAAVASLLWGAMRDTKFESVSYKRGVEEKTIVMTSATWPPIKYRYDEVPEDQSERLVPPSWKHPFGTDFMGRDLFSRMMWGARISLSIGFAATGIALIIGVALGALAGYFRGWVDIALSRFIEIVLCFPRFFIILAVVAFLPPNIFFVMLVLGLFGWMGIARLQRGEFLRLRNLDFVTAAQALGATSNRVMFRHLLPNGLAPVLVAASFGIASAMLTESALSFLGLGVQEPATSWGQILFTGRSEVLQGPKHWWSFTIPGAAIFIAVTCYNLVGDGIRDAVDPRLKT